MFSGDENRRDLSHAHAPTCVLGGGRPSLGVCVVLLISTLHQRDALVVPVHEYRDRQADRQVGAHDDENALDGLAGLVQRGVHHRHDVRIADGDRQRAVLRQVEVLAGHRGDDHAQRLRQDHQAQHLLSAQAQRTGGFPLAVVHRLDARPHHFGDERRRVDHQARQQRGEFR
ncbi:hypothetical protein G6F40_016416 [Rhizopus arrhizus]|nr:hypothetical protein G6F40_016416 [Rhizopus arrhizus]